MGIESFISDCHDWAEAFPDFSTTIKSMEEYRNLVICHIDRAGTHENVYRSTNPDKKTILTTSDFFTSIEDLPPTGRRYQEPAKLIFAFEKGKIAQLIIEEDPGALLQQLGLHPEPQGSTMENDMHLSAKTLNAAMNTALTLREMECVALGFCGFSAKHSAEILKISHRTVETYLHQAYHKMGCFNKQQALESMYEKRLLMLWLDLGKMFLITKNRAL